MKIVNLLSTINDCIGAKLVSGWQLRCDLGRLILTCSLSTSYLRETHFSLLKPLVPVHATTATGKTNRVFHLYEFYLNSTRVKTL